MMRRDRAMPVVIAESVVRYGPAAYVLTLPLEFTSVFLRQQVSRFVLAVVAVAFVYLLVTRRRSLVLPRSASVYLLLVYLAASFASWLLTHAPGSSSALLDAVLYPIVGLLIANVVLDEPDHRRAWIALLVSGFAVAATGVLLYLTHTQIWTPNPQVANRMNITFGDPNITARFLTLCACVAVVLFAARRGPAWLSAGCAVACAVTMPLTFSRSGLALFVVCVVFAILFALDRRRAAALGVAALVAFAMSTGFNPDTRQRAEDAAFTAVSAVTGITAHQASTGVTHHQAAVASDDNRKYLLAAGLKMGLDHPVFGVGFGGYQHALLTTYNRFLPARYTDSVSHTSLVTVFGEQGIVGAALMLAFLVMLAREALIARNRRDRWSLWVAVPAAVIVPVFLYSQFEGRFISEPYLWLALGLFYSSRMLAQRGAVRSRADARVVAAAA